MVSVPVRCEVLVLASTA
jgi:hypothetical protein